MRKFNINIGFHKNVAFDWEIRLNGLDDYNDMKQLGYKFFAVLKATADKKIAYVFDVFTPKDKDMNEVKKHKEFSEICEFVHTADGKERANFQGTFIDALNYIKDNFKA
ncbi:hypothetical protein CCAL9344_01350 [Campylobacter sp. RM9344]|uniref:Uncharacterized protein n=1 Tax=Campylobacter californiensis TaxID=1032243 RepID=A0AAW3ZVH3_9BACT|nr:MULTISPECIES: hypothetical protein [unclassified Campylobacter]MBE2984662.1 hypothetical protein [Campylobacter sp. RM6883]MBE2994578.1 hypothetical protein [Campylobacter sp. RM6913]MBE3028845.1 hypothetical protein [Campylobacter sp. RM9344]MBE3607203.1 hypothetical protein [Campylobacter sp. RM9337]MBE3609497.1 hypothetical protein [Campylobacter sp. RM12916]